VFRRRWVAVLASLGCAVVLGGSGITEQAKAIHCVIPPVLGKVTIGQGLPQTRLVRGKETLVKAYLTLPSTLPSCAGNAPAIKVMGASLTLKNGSSALSGVTPVLIPDAIGAIVTSKSTALNQPADPKFIIRGSQFPPAIANITGDWTANVDITVQYQSRGRTPDAFTSTQSVTFSNAISNAVAGQSKALRILAVPMKSVLDAAHTSALEQAMTALSGMYPVSDNSGSTQPRVGVLPTTQGGIRYAINNPGIVDLAGLTDPVTGLWCGSSTNYPPVQSQIQAYENAWNDANTTDNDVDRAVAVVADNLSTGSPCYEGFTITNTKEAWIRLVLDGGSGPSMSGSLLAMESCHTFDCTQASATRHSLYTNADNLVGLADLAFNPLTWSWLSDDRTAMRFTAPGWNNTTTVFERGDYDYLLCGLGAGGTSCPAAGAGTLTGVPAGEAFVLDGTTDGQTRITATKCSATVLNCVVNSHGSNRLPQTTPAATSQFRWIQEGAGGAQLSNLGVPVRFVHSGHGGTQDVGPGAIGVFSFAFPLNAGTTKVKLVNNATSPPTVLYESLRTAAPTVTGVTIVEGQPPVEFGLVLPAARRTPSPRPRVRHLAPANAHPLAVLAVPRRMAQTEDGLGGARGDSAFRAALLATYPVNSNADPGDGTCDDTCTLRDAILAANANPGMDTISFGLAPLGDHTITPTSALPTITDAVVIDATTQAGSRIELNGSSSGGGNGLVVTAGSSTVRGLVINRFGGNGIVLQTSGGNVIEGNSIGTDVAGDADLGNGQNGILVTTSGNTIGGTTAGAPNVLSGNGVDGVQISGAGATGNKVEGNFIGTNAAGTGAIANTFQGVSILGASGNTIGGTAAGARNVLSGNSIDGVEIVGAGATGNHVVGNYIGTNAAGTAAIGNGFEGVGIIDGANNIIGGTNGAARNVISGNSRFGVGIFNASATGNLVEGNFIGTNAAGTGAIGNFGGVFIQNASAANTVGGEVAGAGNLVSGNGPGHGIQTSGAVGTKVHGNLIGTDLNGTADLGNAREGVRIEGGSGATIGGLTTAARNVLSGNNGFGILLFNATGATVQGNYAGTNVTGTAAVGNGFDGIGVDGGSNNTIGGTAAGAGNLASGNTNQGIAVFGVAFTSTTGNVVQGNLVGTNAAGTGTIGNGGDGIRMHNALNTTVGGTAAGAANVVTGNGVSGITVFETGGRTATGNRISGNSVFANGGLGIDLGRDGVTANDIGIPGETPPDQDSGANNLQNFPDLTDASTSTAGTVVDGTLGSTPSTTFTLEFFASSTCDASGFGEGKTFLGSKSVTTGAAPGGTVSFRFTTRTSIGASDFVTATATDPSGNTSEFSQCKQVTERPPAGTFVANVQATDTDNAADTRATCYIDWGGVKYVGAVGVAPSTISGNNVTFKCPFELAALGATNAGTAHVSVLVDDRFSQTTFNSVAEANAQSERKPPVPSIAAPSPALDNPPAGAKIPEYLQFESIALKGSGWDPEDKHLSPAALTWTSDLITGVPSLSGEDPIIRPPEPAGFSVGLHTITFTVVDSDNNTRSKVATVRIVADADHDGIRADLDPAMCTPFTSGDNDPFNAPLDLDGDGVPQFDEVYTKNGPCVAEDSYSANIDFEPDNLQRSSSGTPITVKVRVPYRSVSQIVGSSVKISKIVYVDANGQVAEFSPNQPTVSWSAQGADGLAKFDRPAFVATLNSLGIANQRILIEVSGTFTDGKTWLGRDATNVK
jgi:CSLREA domain-containing protein